MSKRRTPQVKLGNWRMRPIYAQSFLYADDVVLLASSKEYLQHSVAEWYEVLKWKGMSLNVRTQESIRVECEGAFMEQVAVGTQGM
uniref:Reverse transcriptase domain-containing protein n=1 Tax=Rhodnius prolixus TaxID=13249 RepID=T1IF31_RHOPR